MTVLVSFSLFGTDDMYSVGAVRNAAMYAAKKPDWSLRFYVGRSITGNAINEILAANPRAHVIEVFNERENAASTWWRMRSILDPWHHDTLIFRDTDSRPCDRELAAVDEWLDQDELTAHVIRDHQFHCAVILSGLWGIKGFATIRAVSGHIQPVVQDFWTTDQIALQKVFPIIRRKMMVHLGSSCIYERHSQRRPLRVPRDPGSFVAQGFKADGTPRHPEHVRPELMLSDEYLLNHPDVFLPQYRTTQIGSI